MTIDRSGDVVDVEAIKRRVEAATPLPWRKVRGYGGLDGDPHVFVTMGPPRHSSRSGIPVHDLDSSNLEAHEADADFIIEARTDIPALLTALAAAEKALAFYADLKNWRDGGFRNGTIIHPSIYKDDGALARSALSRATTGGAS